MTFAFVVGFLFAVSEAGAAYLWRRRFRYGGGCHDEQGH